MYEEALDRFVWGTWFGRSRGPVVKTHYDIKNYANHIMAIRFVKYIPVTM